MKLTPAADKLSEPTFVRYYDIDGFAARHDRPTTIAKAAVTLEVKPSFSQLPDQDGLDKLVALAVGPKVRSKPVVTASLTHLISTNRLTLLELEARCGSNSPEVLKELVLRLGKLVSDVAAVEEVAIMTREFHDDPIAKML